MSDFAWVTQALEEENVDRALVLGISLKRVLTRKSVVVIVRPSLPPALRDALESTFDLVVCIDQGKCGAIQEMKMTADSLAASFALSLQFFQRCIYLPPNCIVLKNCDKLFDMEFCSQRNNSAQQLTALQFQPSREAFRSLVDFLVENKNIENGGFHADRVILKWIQNQSAQTFNFLQEPHFTEIKLQGKHLVRSDENVVIGRLVDLPQNVDKTNPETNGFCSAGLLEKFIYGYWLEIYKTEAQALINGKGAPIASSIRLPQAPISSNNNLEPIAIVGMSCRYPSSNNLSEFWNLLIEGRDGIRTPPEHRWKKDESLSLQNFSDTRKTQAGFLSVPVDEFDAKFFGISPKEMIFIDPQHRILHELVWEALEDAAINPLSLNATNCGVFMGSWRNDYYDILQRSSSKEFYRGYMGNSIGAGAARISHLLGLTGQCVATESGCSAAMVAVHLAVRSLQLGESGMALACGVNMLLHPFSTDIMPMVTAPDGHCKSFDASADGFGRAEGCGVLVLKRLSDAVREGDSIWGVIRGSAITQEGISKSMGTPTVYCESLAMRNALRDANLHPSEVSYVESHGTGTIVGDPLEVTAIGRVYGGVTRKEPLVIGSVKTNVGHTEACSGITGIMKVVLSMKNEVIPPHRNFKELNPDINLDAIPAQLPIQPMSWPKIPGQPRTAGVSSFGITGTDGHMILQEPPDFPSQRIVIKGFQRPLHLMTISARSEEALDILIERYKTALMSESLEGERDSFADMAYTANVGRAAFNWRACVVAKDSADAVSVLNSNKLLKAEVASEDSSGKICFLFTGQGSQYPGMAKNLYETSPTFHMYFDRCEEILKKCYNISIAKAFWGNDKEDDLVNRTLFSQTGIFVVEYCLLKLWESWGVKPDYVLGHSLGEFCAAVCAEVLTLEEALILVAGRSRLIDALPQGKMLVIKADKQTVDNMLKKYSEEEKKETTLWLDCAAENSPEQTVFAGDSENIVEFSKWLKEKDVQSTVLKSSHAFHSRHMDSMLEEYKAITRKIFEEKDEVCPPSCGYVSGVLGKLLEEPVNWPEYWVQHTREKVNFLKASKAAYQEAGCRIFLEIGPHPVLSAFTMLNNDGGGRQSPCCLPSLRRGEPDWNTMLMSAAKLFVNGAVTFDWKRFDEFYERKKVGQLLPSYPFIGQKYWPNIIGSSGVQIHPLLGSSIPNPTSTKIFQNVLSLQNVEYLKDHVIGSHVVFPGAGYLETLLMAGHASLDGNTTEFRYPRRPIQLENFRIEAPLEIEMGTGCSCQTVVEFSAGDSSGGGGLYAKMYHEKKEEGGESIPSKWVAHASASFSTYNPGSVHVENREFYKNAIEVLKSGGKEEKESLAKDFYEKVADVGLKFGPAFRTLTKVWRQKEGEGFLAEVQIPEDSASYLLHPTLIDAMIQASVFQGERNKKVEKKLRVPIACERFVWFRPLPSKQENEENICYIYSNGESSKTILLLKETGHPIAALVNVEAIETNAKSIQALLETQTKSIPDMYKIQWKPMLGPDQRRVNFEMIMDGVRVCANEPDDQSDYSEHTTQQRKDIDDLVYYYVISAFLKLGWSPQLNDDIILEKFVKQLGIRGQYKQLVRVYLGYLEEEGILEGRDTFSSDDGGRQWSVKRLPESMGQYENKCKLVMERLILANDISDQALLVQSAGERLHKVLCGTESALRILFPEDKSQPSAAKYYDAGFKMSKGMVTRNWYKLWESVKVSYESKGMPFPVIRFLEVGAGTGFFTSCIVDTLEAHGMQYEYHYTDVSAAFFPAAEKRFEKMKKSFKFLKLDLEQEPTRQGFPPNYYDFICGAQVVHATRDIKETLLNLRTLLKHDGNLVLVEQLGGCRKSDITFGLLEGFWRFTDFELRPHHTNMGLDKWLEVGRLTGFSEVAYSRIYENAVVAYRANHQGGGNYSYQCLSASLNEGMRKIQREERAAWLIFYGDEEEYIGGKLKERLEYIGRKAVISVKHSNEPDVNLREGRMQEKYSIRPSEKEDMDNLFNLLTSHSHSKEDPAAYSGIEGILVAWGLCSKNEKGDQEKTAKPFLNLIQRVLKMDKKALPQIVVLTAGQYGLGDVLCESPCPSTMLGISKCLANEHSELRIRGFDMSPHELDSSDELIFQEMFTGFHGENVGHFCAFRGGERFIPKLLPEKTLQQKVGSALPLPSGTDRFQLIHPKSKSIQDLEFGDLELFTLKPGEIEVKVKCSALNFKDILNILKPTDEFKDSNGIGFDFAGVVTAIGEGVTERNVGDPVFGINIMGNALPSHIKLPADAVVPVPDKCSFNEAACFPAVFSTAYYCLVNIAKAQKGETLLVHTASGGVGLLAIQLARYLGLDIICTAGCQRKRAYLKSLGIQHVFHSRNTEYGKQILEVTNGRGVDIVLNSLTSPGFKEATLAACAEGARFVEMSKLNIWREEEVAEKRPDVQYTIVDLTKLDEATSRKLLEESRSLLEDGVVSPIPYTRFDAQNIRDALTYLQKAQHIGKVVVAMPEMKPGQLELTQVYTPLYNDRSTYLITGGLGGVGMEVCKYMVGQGAKNVVVVGRKPPSQKAAGTIDSLRKRHSANIVVFQTNVGDWDQCQELFKNIQDPIHKLPPLRGIMHCAGTLSDTLIENASWTDFSTTYQAKVNGSWNLHHLTKHMILEHFVLFSSITAPFGSPGQASHVSACTFEDTMAHFRNSHGLCATTINWGQFGQVGVAAEADVYAVRPFTPEQGLNALDCILRQNGNEIVVVSFENALAAAIKYLPYTKRVIDQQVLKMTDSNLSSKKSLHLSSGQFWEEYNECGEEREAKVEMIRKYIKIFLRHVLRLDGDEPIDDNVELQELGVDSLMMLELKNLLQETLGDRITITQAALKDCNTVNRLADRLVQVIEEEGEFSSVAPPTLEEIREMVLEDSKLPENIVAQVPGSERKPSQIKVLLMTGATGSLGSHMLREILEECPQLEKVYCLLRTPRGGESAEERLVAVLERKFVMNYMKNYDKVECLSGNFIEDNLGLSEGEYQRLCSEVDAVLHCGAKVSHVEYYRNIKGGRNDARSVNVGGLLKILKFAGENHTKHVFNMSTMLTSHEVDEQEDTLYEGWPVDLAPPYNRGYLVSKYVGDFLLKEANTRGIPCKSFKFAELRGSRVTGGSLMDSSHFMKSFLFFMKEGIMPETPLPCNFLPIDLASRIAARVMFSDTAPNSVYNVTHPQPQLAQEYFPKLAEEFGHSVSLVGWEEYRKIVAGGGKGGVSKEKDTLLAEFKDLYDDEAGFASSFMGSTKSITAFLNGTCDFFRSKLLSEFVPELYGEVESSYEIHRRDFLAAKNEGIFEKLGL